MTQYDEQHDRAMPPEPELSAAQSETDDAHVLTAVQGLAGLVTDTEDLEDVLGQIAALAVASVPGADGTGVTLMRLDDGAPTVLSWAVTDPFVREIDHVQYDVCHDGPCLTAMQTRRTAVSGSLGADHRWPRFGARVARLGVHSALAVPLIVNNSVVGALNIYSHGRDAFTEHAVAMAQRFAAPAAVTVFNVQRLHAAHVQVTQLQTALVNRATIDQAIGIIRARSGGSAQEAFDRLRRISQSENVKLAVVAERLVDEAVRRALVRRTADDRSR